MQDLDHLFSGLESKAEKLHAAQTLQSELQAHLHNQTQIEMQISQSLIANVTSSARSLHEAVDGATAKIVNMAWFNSLSGDLFPLAWLVLAVAALHWYSPNHAKFVATFIGEFPNTTESSMLIRSHRIYDTRAFFGYRERTFQVVSFGPNVYPLCLRIPNPFLGAYQTCCSGSGDLINRRSHLPESQYF